MTDLLNCPHLNLHIAGTPGDQVEKQWAYFTSDTRWDKVLHQSGDGDPIPFMGHDLQSPHDNRHQFISAMMHRPDGMHHCICVFPRADAPHASDPSRFIHEVKTLFALGPATVGFEGFTHGGMIMTMFDEGLGRPMELNWALGKTVMQDRGYMFTAGMNVRFRRPVPVNSEVCVVAHIGDVQGRKIVVTGELIGQNGEVFATAESIWSFGKAAKL